MSIEKQVAEAILQDKILINLGDRKIQVPRPTLGTMIEVSKIISECGVGEFKTDAQNALSETIRIAKDCDMLADVLAILILGVKKRFLSINFLGLNILLRNRQKRLKNEILKNLTPKTIAEAIAQIFGAMECGFFLSTLIILKPANILKPTI